MLNLSGTQCHALILRGKAESDFDMLQLDVTEELAAGLQVTLRDGLDQLGLRARGDAPVHRRPLSMFSTSLGTQ